MLQSLKLGPTLFLFLFDEWSQASRWDPDGGSTCGPRTGASSEKKLMFESFSWLKNMKHARPKVLAAKHLGIQWQQDLIESMLQVGHWFGRLAILAASDLVLHWFFYVLNHLKSEEGFLTTSLTIQQKANKETMGNMCHPPVCLLEKSTGVWILKGLRVFGVGQLRGASPFLVPGAPAYAQLHRWSTESFDSVEAAKPQKNMFKTCMKTWQ